jgi:hypothetical protein
MRFRGNEDGWFGVNVDEDLAIFDAVSKQIWAVQVSADPGFSGNLHQQFEAAYGPYDHLW